MAQLMNGPFDATKVDPTQGGGQMPVGRHPVIIKGSDLKPTKDNAGGMLVLDLEIIDGPSKGVTGPYRLNLYHQNAQTVEIAHRQLSAICHVTGVYQLQDSQQLHNIPFIVEVGLQKDPDAAQKGYTEVKKVFDMNGNEPGQKAAGNQPAQQNNQAGNGGGWGGGQQQQPQTQQPTQGGGGQPSWGGGQQQQPAQQQQPNAGGGWGGNANANAGGGNAPAGNTPWGNKR